MMMTVTGTPTTTMTAITPPTVAAVTVAAVIVWLWCLSSGAVRCGGNSALWITKCVDSYGTAAVHIQIRTLYSNRGVCLGNKSSQNAINYELVTWAVP